MTRKSTPFSFKNNRGETLAGIIDSPSGETLFTGVFAPCFTCVKESHGAAKICRALAERGVAMLRFDIAGLGGSEGDFSKMNFTTRVEDIVSASLALETPPALLIGHSISGTAALSASRRVPSLKAVATAGSPADPAAVIEKFRRLGSITPRGDKVEIDVLGRPFLFEKGFIDDMLAQDVAADTRAIAQKLFVFHAPNDAIVSYENARTIAARAGDRAELVTLDTEATHLFETRAEDAVFVAETLAGFLKNH